MPKKLLSSPYSLTFKCTVFLLTLSGLAQMPIFKRYYIADLPGLGWLAKFYVTHVLHYIGAMILLFLVGLIIVRWLQLPFFERELRRSAWLRLACWFWILITGGIRMLKNQPTVSFSPEFTMLIDWTHLGLVMLLGIVSLVLLLTKRSSYFKKSTW